MEAGVVGASALAATRPRLIAPLGDKACTRLGHAHIRARTTAREGTAPLFARCSYDVVALVAALGCGLGPSSCPSKRRTMRLCCRWLVSSSHPDSLVKRCSVVTAETSSQVLRERVKEQVSE